MKVHQPCQVLRRYYSGFRDCSVQVLRLGRGGAVGAWLRLHLKRPDVARL